MSPNHDWVPDIWNRTFDALDLDVTREKPDGGGEDGIEKTKSRGPYCIQYDWGTSTGPSEAVVEAVAAITNREPTTMSPLYYCVDPDSLDGLLTRDSGDDTPELHISFEYNGVEVVIDSTGSLEVFASSATLD